ncbi:MAG: hypothetical protein HY081_00385 [Gammaproteobacteria bacterium]|nr:hypothetical protein [Gammaproteobacteria bacterium]
MSRNVYEFLAMGFTQLRREPLGMFLYLFFMPQQLGDTAFLIWHSISIGLQVATPLVLYYLIVSLNGRRDIAAFIAVSLIVLPLDQTLPYVSAVNYRLGLLLGLISLYLTVRAAAAERIDKIKIVAALLLALFTEYILIEAMMALEPARMLLLWIMRYRSQRSNTETIKEVALTSAPFVLLTLPLIAYKILVKPYGFYAAMYPTGIINLIDWTAMREMAGLLIIGNWRMLLGYAAHGSWISPVLGATAGALLLFAMKCALFTDQHNKTSQATNISQRGTENVTHAAWTLPLLGFTILISQTIFFGYAALLPKVGGGTTHAIFMQAGYAILVGSGMFWLIRKCLDTSAVRPALANALFATLVMVGTYFNNLNLDVYTAASARENAFWQAFIQRFPALPERADFLIDAIPLPYAHHISTFFRAEDIFNPYDFERRLNDLYFSEEKSAKNRRYRVVPGIRVVQHIRANGRQILNSTIEASTHMGLAQIHPDDLIVVHYRNGELLVNREIIERYPTIEYRAWADKPLPELAAKKAVTSEPEKKSFTTQQPILSISHK